MNLIYDNFFTQQDIDPTSTSTSEEEKGQGIGLDQNQDFNPTDTTGNNVPTDSPGNQSYAEMMKGYGVEPYYDKGREKSIKARQKANLVAKSLSLLGQGIYGSKGMLIDKDSVDGVAKNTNAELERMRDLYDADVRRARDQNLQRLLQSMRIDWQDKKTWEKLKWQDEKQQRNFDQSNQEYQRRYEQQQKDKNAYYDKANQDKITAAALQNERLDGRYGTKGDNKQTKAERSQIAANIMNRLSSIEANDPEKFERFPESIQAMVRDINFEGRKISEFEIDMIIGFAESWKKDHKDVEWMVGNERIFITADGVKLRVPYDEVDEFQEAYPDAVEQKQINYQIK